MDIQFYGKMVAPIAITSSMSTPYRRGVSYAESLKVFVPTCTVITRHGDLVNFLACRQVPTPRATLEDERASFAKAYPH